LHGAVKARRSATTEKIAEHLSKALAHRAVYEQVQWISDHDAAVDQQCGRVAGRVSRPPV